MPIFHLLLLSLIQGITEFLPISSSGHLLLFHKLVSTPDGAAMDLLFDIAVHVGTLLAVLIYFRRDVARMFFGILPLLSGRWHHEGARLNLLILVGSVPVIAAGFVLHWFDPLWLRQSWILATATIIFGVVLWWADAYGAVLEKQKTVDELSFRDAILIGLAQVLALIPGTSRSGVTMSAALFAGYSRVEAARYSLLLSIVAISGAGLLGGLDVLKADSLDLTLDVAIAMILSCVSALIAIAVMMRWLARQSFKIFAIYRIVLGLVLFGAIFMGWI